MSTINYNNLKCPKIRLITTNKKILKNKASKERLSSTDTNIKTSSNNTTRIGETSTMLLLDVVISHFTHQTTFKTSKTSFRVSQDSKESAE
ncbi:14213_t:CDS:2, partial [Funneliformis caledonium]